MDFSEALKHLKNGEKVSRKGWNGKGMYIYLVEYENNQGYLPYLQISTVDQERVPWVVSQTDLLASDWGIFQGFSYIDAENLQSNPVHDVVEADLNGYLDLTIFETNRLYRNIRDILFCLGEDKNIDVKNLIRERKQKGLETYSTCLYPNNGRDPLKDCIEEIADGLVYYAQFLIEKNGDKKNTN